MIDIQEKKRKIISFIETNGPSLPVRIAKAIQMDPVFASAILSELLESKQVKSSHMKIGASSLYLLPGQEQKLEEQTSDLKSIEKEAYLKIKENKILKDEEEEPAIRVALRNIKDFAEAFKFEDKIMWKYVFESEEEIQKILSPQKEQIQSNTQSDPQTKQPENETTDEQSDLTTTSDPEVPKAWEVKKQEIKQAKEDSKKIESIFEKPKEEKPQENKPQEEKPQAENKTFLKEVEEFLEKNNTKIVSIEEVDRKKVIAKTQSESKDAILFAFNKKKIDEQELMKCYKKAKSLSLPYHIIILGDLTKKMNETMDAYKKLIKIQKLYN